MAVESTTRNTRFDGNGVSTNFATSFEFFNSVDVKVYLSTVLQTEGVDYTVTGGSGAVGSVNFITPPPSGTSNVFLERNEPRTQSSNFVPGAGFPADSADTVHDRLTHMVQELDEVDTRSIKIPSTHTAASWTGDLPDPGDAVAVPATGIYVIRMTPTGIGLVQVDADTSISSLVSKGDLLGYDGVATARLAAGANDTLLTPDSGETTGLKYVTTADHLAVFMATRGDMIVRGASTAEVVAVGNSNDYWGNDAVDPGWKKLPWAQGQCRLEYTDTSTITLEPYNGDIMILKTGSNWAVHIIPTAGVTFDVSTLVASTLYYIYLWNNAGTLTLEASTTAYETEASTGFTVETGDATRMLVGMVYPVAGPLFSHTALLRYVRSWYNDGGVFCNAVLGSDATTASTTPVAITGVNVKAITWANELVTMAHSFPYKNDTTNKLTFFGIGLNATTTLTYAQQEAPTPVNLPISVSYTFQTSGLTEGLNEFYLLVATTSANTTTIVGQAIGSGAANVSIDMTGRKHV